MTHNLVSTDTRRQISVSLRRPVSRAPEASRKLRTLDLHLTAPSIGNSHHQPHNPFPKGHHGVARRQASAQLPSIQLAGATIDSKKNLSVMSGLTTTCKYVYRPFTRHRSKRSIFSCIHEQA